MSRVISMKDVLIVLKMDFSAMCSKCARFGDSSIYRLVYQGIQTNRPDGTHYGPSNIIGFLYRVSYEVLYSTASAVGS
jgi:hypothetical protein